MLMSKAATLSDQEAHYKVQALSYLAQARRILRQLSVERQRQERRNAQHSNIVSEVKAILHRA
jgi:hypothetical protein